MKKPLVSIIIATKNESQTLPRLLQSISKQTYHNFEIIVVDNHSSDRTQKIAREYTQKVYIHGNERSSQRNFGALRAKGNYLLFLDADMELTSRLLSDCIKNIYRTNAAGMIIPEVVLITNFFSKIKHLEKEIYLGEVTIEAPRFITKKFFLNIGGFNNNLIAGEDWDLANRLKNKGQLSRVTSPLYHHEVSLIKEITKKYYYAKHIQKYAHLHQESFSRQSGLSRLRLFWRKRTLLFKNPITGLGLLALKAVEYFLYIIVRYVTRLRPV